MEFDAHISKYQHSKDFLQNGINDKVKYAGWYVVAMQNAVYHLMSTYHAKRGQKNIPHEHMCDRVYFQGDLADLYAPYNTLRNFKEAALYRAIVTTEREVVYADEVFPEFEKLLSY